MIAEVLPLRAGSGFSVERVGLAVVAARASVTAADLDDPVTAAAQEAGDASAVAAGALDAEAVDRTHRSGPSLELGVAAGVGGDRQTAEAGAVLIDRDRDVDVFVGVDPDDDL